MNAKKSPVRAEDIKKGFGRVDKDGRHIIWTATADAEPAKAKGRLCIPVRFDDGTHGFRFPKWGEEIEGVYIVGR